MISQSKTFKQNILKYYCNINNINNIIMVLNYERLFCKSNPVFLKIYRITFNEQSDRLQRQNTVPRSRREQYDIIRCLQPFKS